MHHAVIVVWQPLVRLVAGSGPKIQFESLK
jgi:hypothetical protein